MTPAKKNLPHKTSAEPPSPSIRNEKPPEAGSLASDDVAIVAVSPKSTSAFPINVPPRLMAAFRDMKTDPIENLIFLSHQMPRRLRTSAEPFVLPFLAC